MNISKKWRFALLPFSLSHALLPLETLEISGRKQNIWQYLDGNKIYHLEIFGRKQNISFGNIWTETKYLEIFGRKQNISFGNICTKTKHFVWTETKYFAIFERKQNISFGNIWTETKYFPWKYLDGNKTFHLEIFGRKQNIWDGHKTFENISTKTKHSRTFQETFIKLTPTFFKSIFYNERRHTVS